MYASCYINSTHISYFHISPHIYNCLVQAHFELLTFKSLQYTLVCEFPVYNRVGSTKNDAPSILTPRKRYASSYSVTCFTPLPFQYIINTIATGYQFEILILLPKFGVFLNFDLNIVESTSLFVSARESIENKRKTNLYLRCISNHYVLLQLTSCNS